MTPLFGLDQVSLAALPVNPVGTARLAGEVAKAIATWEPRASVERTRFDGTINGRLEAVITARADGLEFEVDMRATETLSEMRLRPAYLWEPGTDWTPTIGDAATVSADSPSRVIDGVTPVEVTGLDFGVGKAWTVALQGAASGAPGALLQVPGAVVVAGDMSTTCVGVAGSFNPLEDYTGTPEQDYLTGLDEFPPAWIFVSHDGEGLVTVAIGEMAVARQASAPLPSATSLIIGPVALTVERLAYWSRELTAREGVAFFRELQRG